MPKDLCWIVDCGEIEYTKALDIQEKLRVLRGKDMIPDVLLLLEHPPTITMGKKADEGMLRIPKCVIEKKGIPVCYIGRGGKATFHGPGQIVGYAIRRIPLKGLGRHLVGLEEVMLRTIKEYGINATKNHGVWTKVKRSYEKLGAIGVEMNEYGVTMHGFALNANVKLNYYNLIDMCGFKDKFATSIQKVLGKSIDLDELKQKLTKNYANVFKCNVENKSLHYLQGLVKKSTRAP